MANKPRGRPFPPGVSPNPGGRPRTSRNQVMALLEGKLEAEAPWLTDTLIKLARKGDSTALRLVVERILPPRLGRPVALELPSVDSPADASKATQAVLVAMAAGEISPAEATEVLKVVELHVSALDMGEMARRITELTDLVNKRSA